MSAVLQDTGTSPVQSPPADPKRWLALAVLLVATFMDLLDATVVNVAIPSVQHDLSADYASIQWIAAGYPLLFALLLITGGRLGDIYGRKRLFQLGVAGFTVASLLCGVAQNAEMLAGSRLLQGAAAAMMVPQVLAIIHATFDSEERNKAFAIAGSVGGLAAVAGPILGGLLVNWNLFGLSWRPIFLINVPVGVLGLVLGARLIRESRSPHALRTDFVGVGLSTLGLLLFAFPLMQGRELGWPVWGFVSMAASVPVFIGFAAYQRRKARRDGSPLVPPALFRVRSFVAGLGVQLTFYVGIGVFFLSWSVYMQLGLGWSPLHAGLTALAFCFGAFVSSAASVVVLVQKFGRRVLLAGALVQSAGLAAYIVAAGALGSTINTWEMVAPLVVIGLGFGMVAAPTPVVVLTEVPPADAGSASGLVNTMTQLGAVIGVALVSVVFFSPLGALAGASADDVSPQLRHDLVAASVPADRVDSVVSTFRACSVARAGEKNPTVVPASCQANADLTKDPAVAGVLATYGKKAGADTFAHAFQIAAGGVMAVTLASFVVMFGLPRKVAGPAPAAEPVAATA